jgi:hypothetical protein
MFMAEMNYLHGSG